MRKKREMDFETRAYLADRRRRARGRMRPQRQADDWNRDHPVGTLVTVTRDQGEVLETTTRSIAWVICDHASVMVDGISGGYLLSRVRPR